MTRAAPIRVVVVDDDPSFAELAGSLLDAEPDIEVVGRARDGLEALAVVAETGPDVVVMDMNMPRMDGAEATRLLRRGSTRVRVLIVTSAESGDVEAARGFGAAGRLEKRDVPRDLVAAVRRIAAES
jgi:DNA-binding NarL/FixJ family response regulator